MPVVFFLGNILKVVLLIGVLMVHHLTLNLALDSICRPTLTDSLELVGLHFHGFQGSTHPRIYIHNELKKIHLVFISSLYK